MFRQMRRFKQQLSDKETIDILENHTSGILSLMGDDGYPYGVPISYTYYEGTIYFHCGKQGHKMDAINSHDKASFSIVSQENIDRSSGTTDYKSIIAFGKCKYVTDEEEKMNALKSFVEKYAFKENKELQDEITDDWNNVVVIGLKIQHITGKQRFPKQ